MQPRRRTITGWCLTGTGFLVCPCHLVITLPLAVALLGGTALGGWIATHESAIALGATLYFVGALALGATLLLARTTLPGTDKNSIVAAASACRPPNLSFGSPPEGTIKERYFAGEEAAG